MKSHHQIVKNCGNFASAILPTMIAYGREIGRGRGKAHASSDLPEGDGYATKEADIQLGGFLFVQAAQEAARQGRHLSQFTVVEKQALALRLSQEHINKHGSAGMESYTKWMKRTEAYAKHHRISLPPKKGRESNHAYFHRLRRWTAHRSGRWPKLREAVGTHLVFSPEPKLWEALRKAGVNERSFLKTVLVKTMKEFGDWRRQIHGVGHTLGWVAGTHVRMDGADKHPHIHVVVLKRDEAGKRVDWSVSSLKGHRERAHEPDPLRVIKRLFEKNVAKVCQRSLSMAANDPLISQIRKNPKSVLPLVEALRAAGRALRQSPFLHFSNNRSTELGAMIRVLRQIQRNRDLQRLRVPRSPGIQPEM